VTEQGNKPSESIWKRLARVFTSTIFGGLFYSIWLAFFLLLSPVDGAQETVLWLVSPIITAIGFASGIMVYDHFSHSTKLPFIRLVSWPLVGCIIGAVIVYWFGPMLIVFSMLALGAVSVAVREFFWQGR
jgi:hypothetical protein